MSCIIGIDPGSRHTGWGVVELKGQQVHLVACGVIKAVDEPTFPDRLVLIFEQLSEVIAEYEPTGGAVESVFHAKNAKSALKLGHARAAALLALAQAKVPIHEYAPTQVKQAVTGTGAADKTQVARMVEMLLGKTNAPTQDTTDALAVAICHTAIARTELR